jgi:beta-N-acetylhexosaminidase
VPRASARRVVGGFRAAALSAVLGLVVAACASTTVGGRPDAVRAVSGAARVHARESSRSEPRPAAPDPIWARIHKMTLLNKVRQLIVASFSGTQAPVALIHRIHPGGLIYFGDNLTSQAQARTLSNQIQAATRGVTYPMLVMTDQEGGPVVRIPGTQGTPGGIEFHGDASAAKTTALNTGRLMSRLHINTNLAPVSDVNTAGPGGVIGDRSFGSNPHVVSSLVDAQICGYHAGGVATTAKHFPGHGSTDTDSHLQTAVIKESVPTWTKTDLPPFQWAVRHHVDMILVGHLAFPAMDPSGRPATISPILNRRLLRDRLGYQGVVITDALNMGGITSWGTPGEIAVKAIQAGDDMLLMSPQPVAAIQAVVSAVEHGQIKSSRLDTSVYRVLKLKQTLGLLRAKKALSQCSS